MCTTTVLVLQEVILLDPEVHYFAAGRALGDSIESYNGHLKSFQKFPTPLQVKRCTKNLAFSQFLSRIMGSNVPQDDSLFLTEFKDIKILKELEEPENEEDEELVHLTGVGFDPIDFSNFEQYAEANSLSQFIGYVLKKTVLSATKICETCKKQLISTEDDIDQNDQVLNTLIFLKEWRKGALTKPSELANEIFHFAEKLFKANRDKYKNQKNIHQRFVSFLHQEISSKYQAIGRIDEIPKCHMRDIISRFMKGRLFFWANFMNQHEQKLTVNRIVIEEESHSSKTGRAMNHPQLQ